MSISVISKIEEALDALEDCSYLTDDQKLAWRKLNKFLIYHLMPNDDTEIELLARVAAYVFVPSLVQSCLREVFMKFFEKKGINISLLRKWLPEHYNLNTKTMEEIFITQQCDRDSSFIDAVNYFMNSEERNDGLNRNTASHNIVKSLQKVNSNTLPDILNRVAIIMWGLVKFDSFVKNYNPSS